MYQVRILEFPNYERGKYECAVVNASAKLVGYFPSEFLATKTAAALNNAKTGQFRVVVPEDKRCREWVAVANPLAGGQYRINDVFGASHMAENKAIMLRTLAEMKDDEIARRNAAPASQARRTSATKTFLV